MTIADIRQALFEQLHGLETKYAVQFSRGATLYINPANAFGADVPPRMPGGHELKTLYSTGSYPSAADEGKFASLPARPKVHLPPSQSTKVVLAE